MSEQQPVVVIGGGVIGLSIAWELASRGRQVIVLEKNRLGRKASWAGAGILSPSNAATASHPIDRLMGLGSELHIAWSERLQAITGIDNGYLNCGGIYLARTSGEKAALIGQKLFWSQYGIEFSSFDSVTKLPDSDVFNIDPETMVVQVPGEGQICNPDHLQALVAACRSAGAQLIEDCELRDLEIAANRVIVVTAEGRRFDANQICFCAGAWSQELIAGLGIRLPLIPVRGQMLLFKLENQKFKSIINEGSRYIVPRINGHVLVGSTIEEVGFDETTTDEKVEELLTFAAGIVPALDSKHLVKQWAGLRPATFDGFPYMGRLPEFENAFVATGHFKAGLQMSPAIGVIMADVLAGKETIMEISAFQPSRLNLSDDFLIPNPVIKNP